MEPSISTGDYPSQTALARDLGVSRARVNQLLRLLKLTPEVVESVIRMGDPLSSRKITERKLRSCLASPTSLTSKLIEPMSGSI